MALDYPSLREFLQNFLINSLSQDPKEYSLDINVVKITNLPDVYLTHPTKNFKLTTSLNSVPN